MYIFKYGVVLGILELLKLLPKKNTYNIYIYIYIFPKWWFTMGFESVKSTNCTNPRGIHFSKKNMAFLVGGFQLKKDATVKLDHFRAGVKTKNW